MPIHSTLIQNHSFKLRATARGGGFKETQDIKIKLKNCDNISPKLTVKETLLIDTFPSSVSVKSNFVLEEPDECPITDFRISRVINDDTQRPEGNIGNIVSINKFGQVSVIIENPKDVYKVYV